MRPRRKVPSFVSFSWLLLAFVAAPDGARADELLGALPPSEFEQAIPTGKSLTGREIYKRFLHNRYRESIQHVRIISRDPGGSEQESELRLSVRDYRDAEGDPHNDINFKMLVEITAPFDMRHTAYLMIAKQPGPNDEFVYRPTTREVRRVSLRQTSLMGTDYSFRDIGFQSIEGADYVRHPDEVVDGRPVYVIETNTKDNLKSAEYHKTIVYLDQQHYVPLKARYWDDFGIESKQMHAPASSLRAFGEAWVATEGTMRDLRQNTSSTLFVEHLDTRPEFGQNVFSMKTLLKGR